MSKSTRRQFLASSATKAAGLGLFLNGRAINFPPSALPKSASPNERVKLGFIGFGIRGNILLEAAKDTQQANLVEVCDCYQGHLERARQRTDGKIATNFATYQKLLDRKDIDAVLVATPDHWHRQIVLDALSAGKDVYIEKPMTYRIEDGPAMIQAAQQHKRILQVGSQWVSSDQNKKAREIVLSGKLGTVTKVTASYNRNSSTGSWNYPIPPDLQNGVNFNWNEWLGPAPKVAYDPERVFRYRKYWDYSGGISTDLFVHLITSIHFIMGADMPKSVVAGGGILNRQDGREVPDTLDALFDYGRFCVNMAGTFNSASTAGQGIQFLGTEGSLSVLLGAGMVEQAEYKSENYNYSIDSWPKAMQEAFLNQDNHRAESQGTGIKPAPENLEFPATPDATVLHIANFIDAVRTRVPSYETGEVGHRAAAAGHMVNLSYRSGKRMVWDAIKGSASEA
ncbi:MAG TPA: Gfo/Idh/MocA family oxidoreductase [Candidatus Sulfotelmatobacter sp.]|nr:Gfo/Idh/MocA family oxidoreductase [Candidatus Sulfotelmatobacter sp.]